MVYAGMGWSAAERTAFEAALLGPHLTRSRIEFRDLEHKYKGSLTSARVSGSVQVQADSDEATRSFSCEVYDPTDMLGLGVGESTVRPDRMLQVWRGVFIQTGAESSGPLVTPSPYGTGVYGTGIYGVGSSSIPGEALPVGYWLDVPIFCGPVTKPSRSGDMLTLEAQDKTALADSNATTFTVRKGENAATAIRRLMAAIGETRFRIASTSRRLGYDRVLSTDLTPWQAVQSIADSLNWVCFYDGGGYLVCKPRPSASVYTFRAGNGGSVTSQPQRGFWDNDIVNQVAVTGATVAGVPIRATATVDPRNTFSPESLGRHGKVRRYRETIEDQGIATTSEARALADRRVKELALQSTTASFEALACAYHLEEHDPYTVVDPLTGEKTKAAVREMTIPLGHDGGQSMGYAARTPRTRFGTRQSSNRSQVLAARRKQAKAKAREAAKRRAKAKKR